MSQTDEKAERYRKFYDPTPEETQAYVEEQRALAAEEAKRMLTAQDMCRILGIPAPRFQKWCERGIISTLYVKHNGRTYRRYTIQDCWRVALMGSFYREGYEPAVAKQLAEMAEEAKDEAWMQSTVLYGEPLNALAAMSLKAKRYVIVKRETPFSEVLAKLGTDVFITIDLESVRQQINEATAAAVKAYQSKTPEEVEPDE